jgi:hypothetical protein
VIGAGVLFKLRFALRFFLDRLAALAALSRLAKRSSANWKTRLEIQFGWHPLRQSSLERSAGRAYARSEKY